MCSCSHLHGCWKTQSEALVKQFEGRRRLTPRIKSQHIVSVVGVVLAQYFASSPYIRRSRASRSTWVHDNGPLRFLLAGLVHHNGEPSRPRIGRVGVVERDIEVSTFPMRSVLIGSRLWEAGRQMKRVRSRPCIARVLGSEKSSWLNDDQLASFTPAKINRTMLTSRMRWNNSCSKDREER